MATPRKRRKSSGSTGPRDLFRSDFRDQLDAVKRVKPDRDDQADSDRPLTPHEEYRAALKELNNYSYNNETREAIDARQRFDRADRNRRRLWKRSR